MKDSDDEVRERAFFFIRLLEDQGSEHSCLSTDFGEADSLEENEEERDEIKNFIFDTTSIVDVDALEGYVLQN